MKIVQLCPYAMDRPGGVQRHIRDLSAWLLAQGHDVRIVAPPAPGRAPLPAGRLTELGRARGFGAHGTAFELSLAGPGAVRRAARDLAGWGAETVHMHTPWTPALVWQMWRALRLPAVTTIHATLPRADGTGLVDRYIRRAARHFLNHSAAVVVPSEAPLAMLNALVPGIAPRILPPAVDLDPWRKAAKPRPVGRALSLAFLGRLEARKGVDVLLDAWPGIAAALPGAHLTIAGDGALRARVAAAAGPGLTYLPRPDDAAAQALLGGTDIFLAPAPYGESYGLVLAEAMAAGAVPVAAANAGYGAVLAGSDLMVPPGDATALAERVIALARDPAALATRRDWAARRAVASDIATVGPRYEALFSTLAGRAPDR